jgi:hypothetical protein
MTVSVLRCGDDSQWLRWGQTSVCCNHQLLGLDKLFSLLQVPAGVVSECVRLLLQLGL